MNSKTYIFGHRNPDMDSICSAMAYANLKNKTAKGDFVPARCGHLNDSTAEFLKRFGFPKPAYIKDVLVHLSDIQTACSARLDISDPIYKLISIYEDDTYPYSVIPLFDRDKYITLLTKEAISHFFLTTNKIHPRQQFNIDNWESVIPGKLVKRGENTILDASITVGAMDLSLMSKKLTKLKNAGKSIIFITGNRFDAIQSAIDRNVDALILTGMKEKQLSKFDLGKFGGTIFLSGTDTAETIRYVKLTTPIKAMTFREYPAMKGSESFENARKFMLNSGAKGIAVTDDDGNFTGFVTRRNFLEKPCKNVILMDHNETSQAVSGIEEARVTEVIDHHRIDMNKTDTPIFIHAEPVGSTCTIVYDLYRKNKIRLDKSNAILLLGGIVSDTVCLKSPTTTKKDANTVRILENISGIEKEKISEILLSVATKFENMDCRKSILSDFKVYEEKGVRFGIGQCEVPKLPESESEKINEFLSCMDTIKSDENLKWVMLMVSDPAAGVSWLFTTEYDNSKRFQYRRIRNGVYDMGEVLSRKKQLLPEVIRTFEGEI